MRSSRLSSFNRRRAASTCSSRAAVALLHEILGIDRQNDAVDGSPRAVFAQQRQEFGPRRRYPMRRSESWVVYRPAVSRNTASSVNHQSQLRVPPTPRKASFPTRCSKRELQTRVQERRGLAGTRSADE